MDRNPLRSRNRRQTRDDGASWRPLRLTAKYNESVSFDPAVLPMPDLGALCRECDYPLVGLGEHRCPECGWRFTLDDLIPPGEWPLVRIYAQPVAMSKDVRQLLNLQELPYEDNVLTALYGVQIATKQPVYLRVDRQFYFDAVHALLTASPRDASVAAPMQGPGRKPAGASWH